MSILNRLDLFIRFFPYKYWRQVVAQSHTFDVCLPTRLWRWAIHWTQSRLENNVTYAVCLSSTKALFFTFYRGGDSNISCSKNTVIRLSYNCSNIHNIYFQKVWYNFKIMTLRNNSYHKMFDPLIIFKFYTIIVALISSNIKNTCFRITKDVIFLFSIISRLDRTNLHLTSYK